MEFETDNPGKWITHCHNTYHLEAGMAFFFESDEQTQNRTNSRRNMRFCVCSR